MSRRPLLLCAALVLCACAQPPTNPGPLAPGELEFFGHLPRSTQSLAPLPIPDATGNGAAMKAVCCRGSNFSLTNPLPQAFDLVNGVTPGSPPPTSLKTPSWTVAQGIDWSDGSGDNGIGGPNLDLTKLFAGGAQTKWAAMFAGYLRIDPSGSALTSKAFAVASDDGIRLVVSNGTTTVKTECNQGRGIGTDCINFSGNHPTIMDVSFPGTGGLFPFGLLYFQGTGGQGLELRWANGLSSGNPTYTVIPGTSMYAPDLRATLTVEDVNGGTVQPNDVLRYTVTITNVGTLADQQHVFAFKPPANLSAPTVVSTVGTWGTSGGIYGATGMPGLAPGQSQTTIFTAAVAGGAKSGDTVDVQGAVLALVAPLEIETALANDAAKTSQGELYVLTDDPTAGSAFNGTDIGNAPAAFATSQAAGLADDDPTRVTVGAAPVGPPVITGPANPSKSDTLLAVSGTSGQPNGQVVQVYLSGASFSATYSATVNAGAWSATPVALHDGTYTAQAQYQDVSGNLGALSSVYTFVVQSPPKPVITQPADGSTVTNASVLIGGTSSEPDGQVVKVTVTTTGGTAAGTCNATIAGGTWGCSLTLADGSYKAIAQVVEITSDLGSASDKVGFVVSTVSTCDTSLDPTRTPINDDTPAFTGTANPGDGVRVCEGGSGACASGSTTLCSTTASGTGAWTCTPGTALGQGAHLVVAVSQAATSTQVCTSANDAFVVDTVAPAAPTFDAPATPTAVRTPHFTGKGEPGATVHVTDGHGNELCSATVDPNGDWSCDSASLADGTYTLGAYQVDLAGNVGAAATNPLEVDAHVPQTPMLDALASPSKIPIVTLTGSGEAHTSVAIRDQGSTVRCSITDAPVSFTCDTSALPDGAYTFTAIASSRTGVQSAPSNAVTIVIDSTPPAAPHLDDVPSPTAQHRPSFAGTAEPLAAVDVLADGAIACSTNADASGNFVCSSVPVLNNGPHTAHARATDLVGNVSDDSNTVSFTIDDTAAPAPVLDPLAVPEGGEAGFTRETKPTFTGTGVPGDALTVRLGSGTALCDTTVQPDGSFSCTSTFALTGNPATAYTAVAAQTSPTAVTGPDSNTISFTVDTHVPAAPDLTQPASPTTNRQPQLIGSAELLAHIAVRAATSTSASAPVTTLCTTTATTGTFACAPLSPLADGIYQLTAIATSRAGVTSTPSSPVRTLVVGTTTSTPPTAPVIDAPVNGAELADPRPVISGHGQANLTIRVTLDGAALADVTSDATGQWSATPASDVAPGQHKATAVAVDVAGVTSPPSAEVDFSTYANGEVRGGCASTSGDLWALLGLLALFGLARPRGRRALAWSLPRLAREGLLRSQRARVLGPLAFLLLALGGAHGAQAADPSSIDLTRLRPATGPDGALGIDGARPPNADEPRLSFSLLFDAAWQPLVFFPQGGQRQVLIDDRIGAWLTAQSYVAGPVSLVAQLPALLGQQADTSALPPAQRPASSSGAALGDLRLGARVGLLRQERWPLDLAAQLMVSLPTASSGSLAGDGSATAEVSLQASRRVLLFALWDVELLGNALVRLRPARELADVQLGNELGLRAAASWYPDAGSAAVPKRFFLAFDGDLSLRSGTAGGAAPAEWRVGASFCAGSAVALDFGAGTALSSGVGSPRARFLFGLDWAPTTCAQRVDVRTPRYQPDAVAAQGSPEAKTAIVQKLPAREASAKPPANPSAPSAKPAAPAPAAAAPAASTPAAASPTIAKAPAPAGSAPAGNANMAPMVADIPIAAPPMVVASLPDQDGDGVPDADDQCPLVPGPASNRGCPEKAGAISKGPATAELDDLLGAGQVPIAPLVKAEKPAAGSLDRDGDGVPNDEDSCPDKAGPPGNAGCPLSQKMLVSIKGERIALQARIEFAEGSAALEKRSLPLIAQLAEVLQAHPEIERVEVAAHVDSSLGEQGGKALSAARAEAVIAQLSKDGVHIDRLEAAAMGMKHPIAPNATKGGRLQNQRIELRILERRTAAGPKARG